MHAGCIQYRIFQVLLAVPFSVTGNLSFVRTMALKRLSKITPNVINFLVFFLLQRTQCVLPVSAHDTQSSELSTFFKGRMT